MVLGLRAKTRKSPSVQLDYIIHIQEINPWPPSQSLRTLRSVLIQWEHGDGTSGFTDQVVPSLGTGSGVGDGRIEFNESLRLPLRLVQEMSVKGGDGDTYQKNCIEFNLYEPRGDKMVKGQLLGSAVVDLAAYGVIKDNLRISAPINCKRTYRNIVQPLLFLKIQPVETSRTSSSSRDSLIREASVDGNHGESVSALMNEEYAKEAEVASFTTNDDVCLVSSLAVSSSVADSNGNSSPQNKKNESVAAKPDDEHATESRLNSGGNSSCSSSMDLSSDIAWISKRITSQSLQSSTIQEAHKQQKSRTKISEHKREAESSQKNVVTSESKLKIQLSSEEGIFSSPIARESTIESNHPNKHFGFDFRFLQDDKNASSTGAEHLLEAAQTNSPLYGLAAIETRQRDEKYADKIRTVEEEGLEIQNELLGDFSRVDFQNQVTLDNDPVSSAQENFLVRSSFPNIDGSKHGKSVRSSLETSKSSGSIRSNHLTVTDTARGSISSELKNGKSYRKETSNVLSDSRIQHLEHRIKILEGELREAAALEASLYSVVAEHGSSMTKVHAPARRLSRLCFHANKQNPKSGRATAAKSVVSGLVTVAKACGNDVPRLTFWLSNTIVLRVIINKSIVGSELPISVGSDIGKVGNRNGNKRPSPLKRETFPSKKSARGAIEDSTGDWENTLITALEKTEAWMFSRIIESLWWQTFTPHMQCGATKAIRRSMGSDSSSRTSSSIDQQQGNFSLELWEKAFRDACERICPVRAGGHNCGCLPVLSKLIMEQLIVRLDVAMFNAILRESADEIPTDPVSDPITDANVLPIPAAKASFGAGAQLKNAIGNWSRWLTDLFGMDDKDDGLLENGSGTPDTDERRSRSRDTTPKSFRLLNALSDLMMLPKDMLLSQTIRKEVCPTFAPPLIRRILNSFVPDEFCPDPIPGVVLEALRSEDSFDVEEDCIIDLPCEAAPIVYQAPSVASVANILGEISSHSKLRHSGSSLLKKSQTSDDELDELNSPLKAVFLDSVHSLPSSRWMSNDNGSRRSRNTVRYQLLREVWMDDASRAE